MSGHGVHFTDANINRSIGLRSCVYQVLPGALYICMYKTGFFRGTSLSLRAEGFFLCSRLRGTQGGRIYTAALAWAPAGRRGACSGRSKSRELASNHIIAFRPASAKQDDGNPKISSVRWLLLYHAVLPALNSNTSLN